MLLFLQKIVELGGSEFLEKIFSDNEEATNIIIRLRPTHEGFWFKRKNTNVQSWRKMFNEEISNYKKGDVSKKLEILFTRCCGEKF